MTHLSPMGGGPRAFDYLQILLKRLTGPSILAVPISPGGASMSEPQTPPKNPERHSTFIPAEKKSTKPFHPTPMLDQLESGPWPSFVTGLKRLLRGAHNAGRVR